VEVYFEKLPYLAKVKDFATAGIIPGGTYNKLFIQYNHLFQLLDR
jgi:selenophosphate synthase